MATHSEGHLQLPSLACAAPLAAPPAASPGSRAKIHSASSLTPLDRGASVSFGFPQLFGSEAHEDQSVSGDDGSRPETPSNRAPVAPQSRVGRHRTGENHEGLGMGPGGMLARSILEHGSDQDLEEGASLRRNSKKRSSFPEKPVRVTELPSNVEAEGTVKPLRLARAVKQVMSQVEAAKIESQGWEREPPHVFLNLVLGAQGPPGNDEMQDVREHRWTFPGAEAFAAQDRGSCQFIRCLLELQRAVQLEEAGPSLDPRLSAACRTFVTGQCQAGREGHMYHLLTHFLSNSLVFHEWTRFLTDTLVNPRAGEEAFLVPRLELVWVRFGRLRDVLEDIFKELDKRFAWRHRLPKFQELIMDHMRRRCLTPELLQTNPLFSPQAGHRADIVKALKNVAGI